VYLGYGSLLWPEADLVCRTLVLRDNWSVCQKFEPTLADYTHIFPNVSSIYIDLVFPFDRVVRRDSPPVSNGTFGLKDVTAARNCHRLTSVSLSLTKNGEYSSCLSHQWYRNGVVPAIKARLKEVGIDQLDAFHLDFMVKPMKVDRRDPSEWFDLEDRIDGAQVIPAKKVTLDFKGFRLSGQVSELLVSGSFRYAQRESGV
jgi:hypothetical protein